MATKKINLLIVWLCCLGWFGVCQSAAQAASLYLSPASGSYKAGANVSLGIYLSSADQSINAAAGVLNFNPQQAELVSFSKSGSIFNLWVKEPSYSNAGGVFNFEGVVLNPGFIGTSGKVAAVTFKLKSAGTINFNLSSASILANDGKGTNILTSLGKASLLVEEAAAAKTNTEQSATQLSGDTAKAPVVEAGAELVPSAPAIYSSTHPEENKWYSEAEVSVSWRLQAGLTDIRASFSQDKPEVPNTSYGAKTNSLTQLLSDGRWYFNLRLRNKQGFSELRSFAISVDSQKPSAPIISDPLTANGSTTIKISATDELSGIDYYEIWLNKKEKLVWRDDGSSLFALPRETKGLTVRAYDKAGNWSESTKEFQINQVGKITISDHSAEVNPGQYLFVAGYTGLPYKPVSIVFSSDSLLPKRYELQADERGYFLFSIENDLAPGVYRLWVEAVAEGGGMLLSDKLLIRVAKQPWLETAKTPIAILGLCLAALYLAFWFWRRLCHWSGQRQANRQKVSKKLLGNLNEQLALLNKAKKHRTLTAEEKIIIRQLKKDLEEINSR